MSLIGHNNPPEDEEQGWQKQYFYMPISEAKLLVMLLEGYKRMMPFPGSKSAKNMQEILNERISFLNKKMGNDSKGGQS